jgi:hypothetical protein
VWFFIIRRKAYFLAIMQNVNSTFLTNPRGIYFPLAGCKLNEFLKLKENHQ